MKRKGLLKLIIPISLVSVLAVGLPLMVGCAPAPPEEVAPPEPVVIGFIGSFATDMAKSTMRGGEIAIEEFNEAGGILGGRPVKYVKADSAEDVGEGIKAYEYLVEVENVDFIVSGCIDDVSMAWFPRMAEYRVPILDTWTTAYVLIEKVRNEYETYKMYFMDHLNDFFLGATVCAFAKDLLHDQMGWETMALFQEDTAYGHGVAEFVSGEVGPYAGIEVIEHVVYDPWTVDFSPIYARLVAADPDFIFLITSVNTLPPLAQYGELQVPVPMTGVGIVRMFTPEIWEDTGGMVGGLSTLNGIPTIGMEYDPRTQAFFDKYQAKYVTRPVWPHFNGVNGYYGVYEAVEAAERVYQAGLGPGFEPLDAWVAEMEETDLVLYRDDVPWHIERYYKPGEVEPVTGLEWPHSVKFDLAGEEGRVTVVIQWYVDGTVAVVWPPKYATGEFTVPPWIE